MVTSSERAKIQKQLKEYKQIKTKIWQNDYRARLFRMEPQGNGKYLVTIDALERDGFKQVKEASLKGKKAYRAHNVVIDLNKKYDVGSYEAKLQKSLNHNIRKGKKLLEISEELSEAKRQLSSIKKGSKEYVIASKKVKELKNKIAKIKRSKERVRQGTKIVKKGQGKLKKASALVGSAVPAVFIKKGKKVLAFMDAKAFKKASKFKKLKFLKNVKGGDVVMMSLEVGVAVYTVLHGGMTYKKVSALLLNSTKTLASEGFSKGIVFLTPPPATLIVITSIAGAMIVEYAIDKYIELDKRGYVGLEDMLWGVPDEIKNKITVLNLEDTKRETVFDFGDIDKETILDEEVSGETVFDEGDASEKETILEY